MCPQWSFSECGCHQTTPMKAKGILLLWMAFLWPLEIYQYGTTQMCLCCWFIYRNHWISRQMQLKNICYGIWLSGIKSKYHALLTIIHWYAVSQIASMFVRFIFSWFFIVFIPRIECLYHTLRLKIEVKKVLCSFLSKKSFRCRGFLSWLYVSLEI